MILTDLELARRLEEAESFAAEAFARQVARRRPDADLAIEDIVGGRAIYAGPGSPLTEAKAIGLHGPVTDADLDRMEAVFFPRGEPSRVIVCPLADPSMVAGLGRRGYRLSHFENILFLPLRSDDPEPTPTAGIEVRRIEPGEVELYARVVAPNFTGPGESVEDGLEMVDTMLDVEHAVRPGPDRRRGGGRRFCARSSGARAARRRRDRCPPTATGASTRPCTTPAWPRPAAPAATWPPRVRCPAAPPSATPSAAA